MAKIAVVDKFSLSHLCVFFSLFLISLLIIIFAEVPQVHKNNKWHIQRVKIIIC